MYRMKIAFWKMPSAKKRPLKYAEGLFSSRRVYILHVLVNLQMEPPRWTPYELDIPESIYQVPISITTY